MSADLPRHEDEANFKPQADCPRQYQDDYIGNRTGTVRLGVILMVAVAGACILGGLGWFALQTIALGAAR